MTKDNRIQAYERLQDILSDFSVGMLITHGRDTRFHARPMAIARREPDGRLWFLTSIDSEKMYEIANDGRCAVTFQEKTRFLSMAGSITTKSDREQLESLWSESFRPWFPEGVDSPDLEALCFDPLEAEYWDASGTKAVRQLFRAMKAAKDGEEVKAKEPQEHGFVQL